MPKLSGKKSRIIMPVWLRHYFNSLVRQPIRKVLRKIVGKKCFLTSNIDKPSDRVESSIFLYKIFLQFCNHLLYFNKYSMIIIFQCSSMVEQSAVNRSVVGSNPTTGAILDRWQSGYCGRL